MQNKRKKTEGGDSEKAAKDGNEGEPADAQANGSSKKRAKQKDSKAKGRNGELSAAEISGYMPLRHEFAVEWDDDAELILADMEFKDDDPDRDQKLKILSIYNAKLDERASRKQF